LPHTAWAAEELSDCYSEGFDLKACENEIASVESQFQIESASGDLLQSLGSAYHNMYYMSPQGPISDKWEKKDYELLEKIKHSAKSADQFYAASALSSSTEDKQTYLKKTLSLDPTFAKAYVDLVKLYVDNRQWLLAFEQWKTYQATAAGQRNPYGVEAFGLEHGLAKSGHTKEAQEVIVKLVAASNDLLPLAQCDTLRLLYLQGIKVDSLTQNKMDAIKSACAKSSK